MTRRDEPPRDISTERKAGEWEYTAIPIFIEYAELPHYNTLSRCARVIRMDNSTFEKKTLFMEGSRYPWKKLENEFGMDRFQIRRVMFCKRQFDGWLAGRVQPAAHACNKQRVKKWMD